VALDAARWEQQGLKAPRDVPPQVPRAQASPLVLAPRVSQREPQARELLLVEPPLAQASQPLVPEQMVPRQDALLALGLLASLPLGDVRV
jgi:hypothetical protein